MRGLLVLLVAGFVGTSFGQMNLDVEGWQKQFASYDHHSPEWQKRIILSIEDFSQGYRSLIMEQPEFKELTRLSQALKDRIDAIMIKSDGEGRPDLEVPRNEVSKLDGEIKRINRGPGYRYRKVAKGLLDDMRQTLQKGLTSPDEGVRKVALSVLVNRRTRFLPLRRAYHVCGQGREFHDDWFDETVRNLFLEEARKRPEPLLDFVRTDFDPTGVAIALCEVRNPGIKEIVRGWLRSGDRTIFSWACRCITVWPLPEYLPTLVEGLKVTESKSLDLEQDVCEETLGFALRSYGTHGPNSILRVWDDLPASGKRAALKQCLDLPCKATLNLYYRALEDRSPEVRENAAEGLLDLFDGDWDSYYSGRNPGDLTPADKAEAKNRLAKYNPSL